MMKLQSPHEISASDHLKSVAVVIAVQFAPKKRGAPKRKDVSYIAPNGEEIKSRRQLDKYLKAHPGRLTVANFVWTAGTSLSCCYYVLLKQPQNSCRWFLTSSQTIASRSFYPCTVRAGMRLQVS